jgi:predicted ATP-grasp superfamily ATP-dependent carboligase
VLSAITQLPASLAQRFPSSTPSAAVVAKLTHKDQFATLLATLGVPHPRTLVIDEPGDLERFADMAFTHLFLKPVDSATFMRQFGSRAAGSGTGRCARQRTCTPRAWVVVQEYVQGPGPNHHLIDGSVDAAGKVQALFAVGGAAAPPDFGDSTHDQRAFERGGTSGASLCRSSHGGYAASSAGAKRHERDGVFKILGINARVDLRSLPGCRGGCVARCPIVPSACRSMRSPPSYRHAPDLPGPDLVAVRPPGVSG